MRNVLVLGCGRSGTSMLAGTLAGAGYFMGDRLHPARHSNPKGFYESGEINQINEAILALVVPRRPDDPQEAERFRHLPLQGQRWLAQVPLGTPMPMLDDAVVDRIVRATSRTPYCFKDPRFSYTLPAWRPFLQDAAFVCIFRHPAIVVESILKECREMENLHSLEIDHDRAQAVWCRMYEHVLTRHRFEGDWLFLEYNQLFETANRTRLSEFVRASLDEAFPDVALSRSRGDRAVGAEALAIYRQLSDLAGFVPGVGRLGTPYSG